MNIGFITYAFCSFIFFAVTVDAQTTAAPLSSAQDSARYDAQTSVQIEAVALPDLISEAQASSWLRDDPAFSAASHELQAAQAAAGLAASSPHEWTASYTRQQRDYRVGDIGGPATSSEWNLELERGVRLPGKRGADKRIAKASLNAALAQSNLAQRNALEDLLIAYSDGLLAQAQLRLLTQQYAFARNNLNAVQKRVKSGDAAALEARLAEAEAANVAARLSLADTQAKAAWNYLHQRYPLVNVHTSPELPKPIAVEQSLSWWQQRIEAASDGLKIAQAEQEMARAAADRARLERIPDPTIGVFTARESFGNEQVLGVRIRMPLPGERRSLGLRQKLNQSLLASDTLVLTRRQLSIVAQGAFYQAQGDYRRWQLADQYASAQRENARLLQKAYSLGEQDLQSLLLGQQQSLRAAEDEQNARAAALRSYYQLLLDAKLLWRDSIFAAASDSLGIEGGLE